MSNSSLIAVLITSHNRCEFTIRCLSSLFRQESALEFEVFLVDDGSKDDTGHMVRNLFPAVNVIDGDGSLYWAGGMRMAWEQALHDRFDGYLWLNDDVELDRDAISRIIEYHETRVPPAILGGATRDPETGAVTYSGSQRYDYHPMRFERVEPGTEPLSVAVLNGNVLFVPAQIAREIGIMAPYLVHSAGDYEYCIRARRHGIQCLLLPGTIGTCSLNLPVDSTHGIAALKHALSAKVMPLRASIPLYRAMGGPVWAFWLFAFYFKSLVKRRVT